MRKAIWLGGALALLCLLLTACSDPMSLGTELLEEDQVNFGFTDTLPIKAETVAGVDTLRTFTPSFNFQLQRYLFGDFRDPIFGKSRSSIYIQPRLSRPDPDFSNSRLDSVVLVLPYDTSGFYGRLRQDYGMEVHRITEFFPPDREYFSTDSLLTDPEVLARETFTLSTSSFPVVDYLIEDEPDTILFPHLRVHLDQAFGEELLNLDTTVLESDSAFLEFMPGLHLQPTRATEQITSFNLRNDQRAGIYLYYIQNDTTQKQFRFEMNEFSGRFVTFDHGYEGTVVGEALQNPNSGEDYIYVQGMAGVDARISLTDLSEIQNTVINQAQLEVRVASLPEDNINVFTPPPQILLAAPDEDGDLLLIEDAAFLVSDLSLFGGMPLQREGEPTIYRFNISTQLQQIIEGAASNEIYLTVSFPSNEFSRATPFPTEVPNRAVLFGTEHPEYPIRLQVNFTRF